MKRTTLNILIDALSFAGFVLLSATGFLLHYALPPGSGRLVGEGSGLRAAQKPVTLLWGMTGHEWGAIHYWIAVAFIVLLAVHLVLHWQWIVCVVKGRPREGSAMRAGLGLFGALCLVMLAIAPFLSRTQKASREEILAQRGTVLPSVPVSGEPENIHGTMTLGEVERATGVSISALKRKLGLPETVSSDDTLGQLRRRFSFTMQDVRRAVRELKDSGRTSAAEPCDDGGKTPCGEQ